MIEKGMVRGKKWKELIEQEGRVVLQSTELQTNKVQEIILPKQKRNVLLKLTK